MRAETYMRAALDAARKQLGKTYPNPSVGAVIVKNNSILAVGATQPPGGPHAEIVALKKAGADARGATMYVTLEPCCIWGRTPPCTDAIIAAGIRKVVYATADPNPKVAGKGAAQLKKTGVAVERGVLQRDAAELNEWFFKYITTGMPYITLKLATTLDGKIASRSGKSKYISCKESLKYVHRLRAESAGIVIGKNTALADDPELNVRFIKSSHSPFRIAFASNGELPPSLKLFKFTDDRTIIVCGKLPKKKITSADYLQCRMKNGTIDAVDAFKKLAARGIANILLEGGSALAGSCIDAGIVDRVVLIQSPVILGGEQARSAIGGVGFDAPDTAAKLRDVAVRRSGADIVIEGYLKRYI